MVFFLENMNADIDAKMNADILFGKKFGWSHHI